MHIYLNPYLFFLLKQGETIVWDYKNHCQFELDTTHYVRLKELSKTNELKIHELTEVDQDLLNAKLISLTPNPSLEWQWDELGLMYHVGTQNLYPSSGQNDEEWVRDYLEFCQTVALQGEYQFITHSGEKISLPQPNFNTLASCSLLKSFRERLTSRSFNGKQVSLKDFSTILFVSFGLFHGEWEELNRKDLKSLGIRKAHPSGGGLHPVEAYVMVFNVQDIPPGIYHYNVQHHHLNKIAEACEYRDLKNLVCGQFFGDGIAFGVFLTAHFDKVWHKYVHSRSFKDVFLDAGHVSQTFLLTATALDLLTWETAWFKDGDVATLLKVNGISIAPLFFLGVGYGNKVAIPVELEKIIKS
jgi:SagB-type dehydrogenase family enzyme